MEKEEKKKKSGKRYWIYRKNVLLYKDACFIRIFPEIRSMQQEFDRL